MYDDGIKPMILDKTNLKMAHPSVIKKKKKTTVRVTVCMCWC